MGQLESTQPDTDGRGKAHGSSREISSTGEALKQIALTHRVCYEVWPEWSASNGRATRIGFALSLCGIHENGTGGHDVPACPRCWSTYAQLRMVAEWIRPEQERACRFEIAAFDRAWHVAPSARQGRNEVLTTVKIFHRCNINAPIDDCQQQCLKEMRERLHALSIRENVWAS